MRYVIDYIKNGLILFFNFADFLIKKYPYHWPLALICAVHHFNQKLCLKFYHAGPSIGSNETSAKYLEKSDVGFSGRVIVFACS